MNVSSLNELKPSPEFKKSVGLVIVSILVFFIIYLTLLAIAGFLSGVAIYFGAQLIFAKVSFITLAAGGGLIALGVMFFFFLIKFIFSVNKDEDPLRIEIKERDEPKLFEFLRAISEETKTKFPKKVFLSPDVNAFVFYNSSFWSMFFPIRKNLNIGIGLINCVSIEEFKAIIAHEYGHFSQKSMTIGSYVYVVNKSIYNLVYEYDNWDKLIEQWANAGGFFGIFAHLTHALAEGVRFVLKISYNLININYLKLSREMEYHADNVAALVAGKENLISALRKLEFGNLAYNHTTSILNQKAEEQLRANNLYEFHKNSILYLAKINDLKTEINQPIITDYEYNKNISASRVNVKDMWATHPSIIERKTNVDRLNTIKTLKKEETWSLMRDKEDISLKMTEKLYSIAFPETKFEELLLKDFLNLFEVGNENHDFSEKYNGHYDNRPFPVFDINTTINTVSIPNNISQIYNKEKTDRISKILSDENDMIVLEDIKNKNIKTKFFEFDGEKYKRRQAKKVIEKFNNELTIEREWLENEDKAAFLFHLNNAKKKEQLDEFSKHYETLSQLLKELKTISEILTAYESKRIILYTTPRWNEDNFSSFTRELSNLENRFRKFIKELNFKLITNFFENEAQQNHLTKYMNNKVFYISVSNFREQSFIDLYEMMGKLHNTIGLSYSYQAKSLTDFQLKLLN